MPYEDDEVRRAARERLEARMQRRGSADTLASHATKRAEERERIKADSTVARESSGHRAAPRPVESFRHPELYTKSSASRKLEIGPLSLNIPGSIPPFAIPLALAVVVLLVLALVVGSCTRSDDQAANGPSAGTAASGQAAPSSSADATATSSGQTTSSAAQTASQASGQAARQAGGLFQKIALAKDKALKNVQGASQVDSVDTQETRQGALSTLLGDETSAKLLAEAKTNKEALWIAAHPGAYAFDGVEVQYKVLKLAADEPAALTYVREFPTSYPSQGASTDQSLGMSATSPAASVSDTDVPHFYQWDRRWGYTTYSGAAFGLTGCGPTSLAMVYQGLTGKTDKNPYEMGKLADERGYMSEYEGTVGTFFTEMAEELGLSCEELYPETETLKQAIEHGKIVILNLAPGYFTATGHYLVVTELANDGQAIINDPYSVERSSQTWDLELLTSQSYTMFAYTKADADAGTEAVADADDGADIDTEADADADTDI